MFDEGDRFLLTLCKGGEHNFHDRCLIPWIRGGKNHCPICRERVYLIVPFINGLVAACAL